MDYDEAWLVRDIEKCFANTPFYKQMFGKYDLYKFDHKIFANTPLAAYNVYMRKETIQSNWFDIVARFDCPNDEYEYKYAENETMQSISTRSAHNGDHQAIINVINDTKYRLSRIDDTLLSKSGEIMVPL